MHYIIKRAVNMILLLIAMTFINFSILYFAPGNPIDAMANPKQTEYIREKRKEEFGLNRSVPVQYLNWIKNILKGEFGRSFATYEDVGTVLSRTFSKSVLLTASGFLLGVLLSFVFGIASQMKPGKMLDRIVDRVSLFTMCVPTFLLGLIMIYFFALRLKWLPTGGSHTLGYETNFKDICRHLILPASVLGLSLAARNVRFISSSLRDLEDRPFVLSPKARGASRLRIVGVHMLRNALMPIVTNLALEFPAVISGALVTEKVFNYPGMGSLMMDSIARRDYPVIMGVNLWICIVVVGIGFLLDLLYYSLDKRIGGRVN